MQEEKELSTSQIWQLNRFAAVAYFLCGLLLAATFFSMSKADDKQPKTKPKPVANELSESRTDNSEEQSAKKTIKKQAIESPVKSNPIVSLSFLVLEWQLLEGSMVDLTGQWKSSPIGTRQTLEIVAKKARKTVSEIMVYNAYLESIGDRRFTDFSSYSDIEHRANQGLKNARESKSKWADPKLQLELTIQASGKVLDILYEHSDLYTASTKIKNMFSNDGRLDLLGVAFWTDLNRKGLNFLLPKKVVDVSGNTLKKNGVDYLEALAIYSNGLKDEPSYFIQTDRKLKDRTVRVELTVRKN